MSVSELPVGTELIFAENREVEGIFKCDKNIIADRVWTTCRPTPKFSSSTPTVTARRIQIVRVQMQSNPRLVDAWETETAKLNEDENEEDDSDESSSPGQCGCSKKKATDKSSSCSAENETHAQHSSDSSKHKMSQKSSACSTDASLPAQCTDYVGKKKSGDRSSAWTENVIPPQCITENAEKVMSQIPVVCSSEMPMAYQHSRRMPHEISPCPYGGNVAPAQFDISSSRKPTCQNSSARSANAQEILYGKTNLSWFPSCLQSQYGTRVSQKSSTCSTDAQNGPIRSNRCYEDSAEVAPMSAPSSRYNICGGRAMADERHFFEANRRTPSRVCHPDANVQESMAASGLKSPSSFRGSTASVSNGFDECEQTYYGKDCPPEEERESYDGDDCDLDFDVENDCVLERGWNSKEDCKAEHLECRDPDGKENCGEKADYEVCEDYEEQTQGECEHEVCNQMHVHDPVKGTYVLSVGHI